MKVSVQRTAWITGMGPARLPAWLTGVLAEIAPDADTFAVWLASDRELRRLNADYRGKDRVTDVLSFPGEDGPEGKHLGDVAISLPAAGRQAREAGHTVACELRILALHGALHCMGYDHETDDGSMEAVERRLRRRWLNRDA